MKYQKLLHSLIEEVETIKLYSIPDLWLDPGNSGIRCGSLQ